MDIQRLITYKKFLSGVFSGKRILISGATGLIGSRIVEFLADLNDTDCADIQIIGLYRNQKKKNALFSHMLNRKDVQFVQYTIGGELHSDVEIDYAIHCAGVSGGMKMHLEEPVEVFKVGIGGTHELLDYAVLHGCQGFLYISTYEVYGNNTKNQLICENHACELDTFVLRNIYAEIKRLCESLCCAYSVKYNMDTYAARLTSTFGAGVAYEDPRFFAEFSRCIIEGRDIVLRSKGETVRSYLDADDAAIAFLYILANGKGSNVYNVTNMANVISIKDIALKMIQISKAQVDLKFDLVDKIEKEGYRQEGITLMDASKIENIGWKPVYTLEDTLEKMIFSMKMKRGDK